LAWEELAAMGSIAPDAATGVVAIDAGNDGLRFLLDRMFKPGVECRKGAGGRGHCDTKACARIDAMLRYLGRNFARQERLMADSSYPEADRHGAEHANLMDSLGIMMKASVCADRDGDKVREFIAHWAGEHVRACDHPLGRWATTRRVVQAAE
jgi:hemerythrin